MATLKIPVTEDDHIQGQKTAAVTLVEYGDYECPYCGQAYYVVKQLQEHFGKKLRFVFRNFPLAEMHPMAKPAAEAAEFAATEDEFWQMHDLIYENQDQLDLSLLLQLGKGLSLPVKGLASAIENDQFEEKIKGDLIGGARSGVNGTPTFFINGERYNGPFDYQSLSLAIQSLAK